MCLWDCAECLRSRRECLRSLGYIAMQNCIMSYMLQQLPYPIARGVTRTPLPSPCQMFKYTLPTFMLHCRPIQRVQWLPTAAATCAPYAPHALTTGLAYPVLKPPWYLPHCTPRPTLPYLTGFCARFATRHTPGLAICDCLSESYQVLPGILCTFPNWLRTALGLEGRTKGTDCDESGPTTPDRP